METKQIGPCDSIAGIAADSGHLPDTIWNHKTNARLKQDRENPYVLAEGDVITIPDKRPPTRPCATSLRHRFQRKAIPDVLNLQLLYEGKARAGLAYELEVAGQKLSGVTDKNGRLSKPVPPNAREAVLKLGKTESYRLQLSGMDPESTETGLRKRLVNLGFLRSVDASAEEFAEARCSFLLHLNEKNAEALPAKLRSSHGA